MIGSGPIVIGQAAEFDYAGAQACRVLKEAGVNVVLVNSNPATIMTDKALADEIYLEPLTVETLKRIIRHGKAGQPAGGSGRTDGAYAGDAAVKGWLSGRPRRPADRRQCRGHRQGGGSPAVQRRHDGHRRAGHSLRTLPPVLQQALKIADEIGYPVIVRPAFTLGGAGGGAATDADELRVIARDGPGRLAHHAGTGRKIHRSGLEGNRV